MDPLQKYKVIMDQVDTYAMSTKTETESQTSRGVKLILSQRQRLYDPNRVPVGSAVCMCPECGHQSINEQPENYECWNETKWKSKVKKEDKCVELL
eukprot:2920312-Ditylum_brightwellii.AAC.2